MLKQLMQWFFGKPAKGSDRCPTEAELIADGAVSTCAGCGHKSPFQGWGRVCPNCRR